MNRRSIKSTAVLMAFTLALPACCMTAYASQASDVLAGGGVSVTMNGTPLQAIATTKANIQTVLNDAVNDEKAVRENLMAEVQNETPVREDDAIDYANLVIAQVNAYVNVRIAPDEESEVLGKLYNNAVGKFLGESNGWYMIDSGTVTGYVKAEYCVTGEEAVELAKKVGVRIATVNTTTLKVREEAGLDAAVLGLVPMDDELVVLEEQDDWVMVDVEEGKGWVSRDYVSLRTDFVKAESKKEEEERLKKEEEERRKAQEAAELAAAKKKKAAAAAKTQVASSETQTSTEQAPQEEAAPAQTYATGGGSDMGKAVADYALQFVGNPYVYGGSSLTNGTDCSGFVMSVYANFGVSLPHSSSSDRSQGTAVDGLGNAQPGDIVCYSGHVALYIGNNQIVHASTKKTGIIVSNADYKKVLAVRRIF